MGEFLWRPISGSPVYACEDCWLWHCLVAMVISDHMIITVIIKPIPTDPIGKVIWPKQHNIKLVWLNACCTIFVTGNVWSVDQREQNMIVQKQLAGCVYMS